MLALKTMNIQLQFKGNESPSAPKVWEWSPH